MSLSVRRPDLRSLRLRLPLLLLMYCAAVGVAIFLIVDRTQERRFEREFADRQLLRATELQDRTERAAERSELETAQREFGELASFEALRGAVFVARGRRVLLSSRREWLNRTVELAALGVPQSELALVETQMGETLATRQHHTVPTNGGNGLVLIMPASLPLVPGALAVDRSALIVLVYDLSLSKAINTHYLRQLFLLIAGAMVLGVAILGVGLHFFVTRRLERVQAQMARFAAGEAIADTSSRVSDEIGAIGERFQSMARAVRHEMSERLEATAALRASEEKFRTAMEASPIGWALVNPDGYFIEVNSALCRILGYSKEELRTRTFRDLTHPDDLAENIDFNRRMLSGVTEPGSLEKRYVHKDGHTVWAQLNAAVVSLPGQPIYAVSQIQDISDRKRAEDRLRRANRTLRTISHCNQALVHATDEASLLREICRVVVEDGGFKLAWVGFARGDRIFAAASHGEDNGYVDDILGRWHRSTEDLRVPMDLLRLGKPAITDDYFTEPAVESWRDIALARGFRSSAMLPLKEDGRTFGALLVYSDQPGAFDDNEMAMLAEMSDDLAYGIQALRTRTRRERAEQELRESQTRLVIAMDMAKLAPWERDASTGMFLFNETFYALLGTTAEAEGGMQMSAEEYARRFLPPEEAGKVQEEIDRSTNASDPSVTHQAEHRFRRADGSIGHMLVRRAIVKDASGRTIRTYGVNQDITERKQAEEAIRAANERYARHETALAMLTRCHVHSPEQFPDVLRSITEVVAGTLEVGRVSIWRRQSRECFVCDDLFEWPQNLHSAGATLTGEIMDDFSRMLSESDVLAANDAMNDYRISEFARVYLTDSDIRSFLSVPIRGHGEMFASLSCASVGEDRRWTPDEQTFVVAVANLLSSLFAQVERLRLEAQLRQATKLEGIGQLAGGVAHDFNNVLTVIIGKAGLLVDDARLPVDLRDAVEDITHSAERAANLTRQLLAFSRRQAMQVRDHDLNGVIRNVTRLLDRILGEDLTIELSLADEPIYVRADAGMLDQVMLNLAVNARDAMRDGGRLGIRTSLITMDSQAAGHVSRPSGPYACLEVSDSGSGIPPEHLPHIFEPFFTTKDVGKGTGLGLATTYGIVQQHNGWIDVTSEIGQGTTFSIYLPSFTQPVATIAEPAAPARVPAVPRAALDQESILVVEDEGDVRSLIVDALIGFGYRVLEAASGRQALEVWNEHASTIDLLITDMVMPGGMNGLDLASSLKRDRPGLRIIYISGYLADVSRESLAQSEGAAYLAKPFTLPALARLVRQSLDAVPQTRP